MTDSSPAHRQITIPRSHHAPPSPTDPLPRADRCGDPLLALCAGGLDVQGLDSSGDMLAKLQRTAAERGIDATVHHSTIEVMDLGTTFRSIFLAGPTFNLVFDDTRASAALARIRDHLDPAGAALIPLFVPNPVSEHDLAGSGNTSTTVAARCG